jgi:hypothetical protein
MRFVLNVITKVKQKKKEIYPVTLNIFAQNLDISLSVMQKIPIPPITIINQNKSQIDCLHSQLIGAKSI